MEGESPITLDGEVGGPAPAQVRLVPRGLRVLLPKGADPERPA
jgi:diacylglycerol kinase family enzyme